MLKAGPSAQHRDISLFKLICGRMKRDYTWAPFAGAYVNLDRMDGFRQVRINSVERYCVKRGEAALELFEPSPYRGFIGYVLKSIEAVLSLKKTLSPSL